MNDTETEKQTDQDRAEQQAKAQLAGIVEMVEALDRAEDSGLGTAELDGEELDRDSIMERISEDPLSVQVRTDWHSPGEEADAGQYEILLCTGGPAVRIVGGLDQYGQPGSATLEYQDWFTPWMECWTDSDQEKAMLRYAQNFYFGS